MSWLSISIPFQLTWKTFIVIWIRVWVKCSPYFCEATIKSAVACPINETWYRAQPLAWFCPKKWHLLRPSVFVFFLNIRLWTKWFWFWVQLQSLVFLFLFCFKMFYWMLRQNKIQNFEWYHFQGVTKKTYFLWRKVFLHTVWLTKMLLSLPKFVWYRTSREKELLCLKKYFYCSMGSMAYNIL